MAIVAETPGVASTMDVLTGAGLTAARVTPDGLSEWGEWTVRITLAAGAPDPLSAYADVLRRAGARVEDAGAELRAVWPLF